MNALEEAIRRWRPGPRAGIALTTGLFTLGVFILLRTAWLCDDSYITLRVIDNFIHGHGPRWNVAERVLVFTHPLWFFLLSLPTAISHQAYSTTITVSFLVSGATLALVALRARRDWAAAALALTLLLSSRAFIDYSSSGLENPLSHLLLLLFVLELGKNDETFPALVRLSLLAGLAVLNRLDTALLFLPGLSYVLWKHRGRRTLATLAIGSAPVLLWELFALIYYGVLVPNTALAKLASGVAPTALFVQGVHYLTNSLRLDPLTLIVIAAAVVLGTLRGSGRDRALAAGIVCYLFYVLRIGGDFMSGRFLSAPFLAAVLLLMGIGRLRLPRGRALLAALGVGLSFLAPTPPILSGPEAGLRRSEPLDVHGIADERRVYFATAGLWNGIPGPKPIRTVTQRATGARREKEPLAVEGAVGVFGYFAGPTVHVIDIHALGDPLLARLPMVRDDPLYNGYRAQYGLQSAAEGWRIGHFLRTVPSGYAETILTGENRIPDPAIHHLQDAVALLTRAPIWNRRRLAAIVKGEAGRAARAVSRRRPEYQPFHWDEPLRARPECGAFYRERALERFHTGDREGAREDILQAVRFTPQSGAAWSTLGELERLRGDDSSAVAAWKRGLQVDPEENSLYLALGDWYIKAGEYEQAVSAFRSALRLNPLQSAAASNLGLALIRLNRQEEAIPILLRSRKLEPMVPDVHANLGFAYFGLRRLDASIAAFRQAVRLGSDEEAVWRGLGLACVAKGEHAEAVIALENAGRLNPRNADTAYLLAALYQKLGQRDRALETLRRAAALGDARAVAALREAMGGD